MSGGRILAPNGRRLLTSGGRQAVCQPDGTPCCDTFVPHDCGWASVAPPSALGTFSASACGLSVFSHTLLSPWCRAIPGDAWLDRSRQMPVSQVEDILLNSGTNPTFSHPCGLEEGSVVERVGSRVPLFLQKNYTYDPTKSRLFIGLRWFYRLQYSSQAQIATINDCLHPLNTECTEEPDDTITWRRPEHLNNGGEGISGTGLFYQRYHADPPAAALLAPERGYGAINIILNQVYDSIQELLEDEDIIVMDSEAWFIPRIPANFFEGVAPYLRFNNPPGSGWGSLHNVWMDLGYSTPTDHYYAVGSPSNAGIPTQRVFPIPCGGSITYSGALQVPDPAPVCRLKREFDDPSLWNRTDVPPDPDAFPPFTNGLFDGQILIEAAE